ncbi:MAG: amidase [Pseudomonadota bacterium]
MTMKRRTLLESGAMGAAFLSMAGACARQDQSASNDLAELDAVETAARIKSGALSAEEAVDAAIDRAQRIEPQINAIVTKTYGRARKAAANADGPMAGVPTFVKDLDDVTGVRTAFGSRAFPGYRGKEQTLLTNAFLGLGVVSLGKSATPEFGLSATTEPLSSGKTRNPWNTDHSTGGSSGGAAALVASGVVPIAHASDGGGSIRIPASCCGNVGLKVSRGRYPQARVATFGPIDLSVHGVQSRTVRDTAAVTAAMELPPEESGLAPVGLVSAPAKRQLKIALVTAGLSEESVDPRVVTATEGVGRLCADLGHVVEPISFPIDPIVAVDFHLYWAAFAHGAVSIWEKRTHLPRNGLAFEPFTLGLAQYFEDHQDEFEERVARLQTIAGVMDENVYANYDLVLSPVVAAPPPRIGYLDGGLRYDELIGRLLNYVQFTAIYNITGAPAISLPLSMTPDGLPVGAMFGARLGDEKTLLELSYELEEAKPWSARRPAVFG